MKRHELLEKSPMVMVGTAVTTAAPAVTSAGNDQWTAPLKRLSPAQAQVALKMPRRQEIAATNPWPFGEAYNG